jgi:predicted nucleotidyltransferase
VRTAVLYGSAARGDDGARSDLDLLVSFGSDSPDAAVALAVRLERAVGRAVDVARLERVSAKAPLLLLQAIEEGRPIVDRDGRWPDVLSGRAQLRVRATRAHGRRLRRAADAVAALVEE